MNASVCACFSVTAYIVCVSRGVRDRAFSVNSLLHNLNIRYYTSSCARALQPMAISPLTSN
jgi:hypothetical protein